jgi:hypothetical protein
MIHANVDFILATILARPRRKGAEFRRSPGYPHLSQAGMRNRFTAARAWTTGIGRGGG